MSSNIIYKVINNWLFIFFRREKKYKEASQLNTLFSTPLISQSAANTNKNDGLDIFDTLLGDYVEKDVKTEYGRYLDEGLIDRKVIFPYFIIDYLLIFN